MMRGGNSIGARTDLVLLEFFLNTISYRDNILQPFVFSYAANTGPNFHLMNDNAHLHIVRVVNTFLDQHNFEVLIWPPQTSDLNSIEHPLNLMRRRLLNQQAAVWISFGDRTHSMKITSIISFPAYTTIMREEIILFIDFVYIFFWKMF